jgi:hypothetical protein
MRANSINKTAGRCGLDSERQVLTLLQDVRGFGPQASANVRLVHSSAKPKLLDDPVYPVGRK